MVWQRFAKSPRIACAGSTPVASANCDLKKKILSAGVKVLAGPPLLSWRNRQTHTVESRVVEGSNPSDSTNILLA